MANLDELYSEIPTQQIAGKLGVDPGELDGAIKTLVPVLLGSLHHNAQDPGNAAQIESVVTAHAASGLLEGGVNVDQVDQNAGNQQVSRIFGGNDTGQVASALAGTGAGGSDLIKRLLPILAPIVLAYIGKQLMQRPAPAAAGASAAPAAGGGGLAGVLGSILGGGGAGGGGGGGGSNPLGSILSGVLGGKQGGAIGEILGGLLGDK